MIDGCMTPDDVELYNLLNNYRVQNGQSALPPSQALGLTAQWKIWDRIHNPGAVAGACGTHSWSSSPPAGVFWTGVCWTGAQSTEMWVKPREITGGVYTGNGFELTADTGGLQTPAQALAQWQGSPAHNTVILQQGVWGGVSFQGMGVDLSGGYAILWFGDGVNNGGLMQPCVSNAVFVDGFEER